MVSTHCTARIYLNLLTCLIALLSGFTDRTHAQCICICDPALFVLPYCEPLQTEMLRLPKRLQAQECAMSEDPPTPAVAIRMRVPASGAVGQDLDYRIIVENTSLAAAHHVLVRNPVPANARFVRASPEPAVRDPELQWRLGTLEPG